MSTVETPKLQSLLTRDQILARVEELGAEITRDYAGRRPIFLCVLKGSLPFYSDLVLHTDLPVRFDYLAVSSYQGTESTGTVTFRADLSLDIRGEDVLIVEDIVDTGHTMSRLLEDLGRREPSSVKVVSLLDKPSRREVEVPVDYCGFEIPDKFVVGYGLDYEQYFRNLPYIAVLEEIPEI